MQRAAHDAAVGRVAYELRGARDVRSAGVVRGCRSVQIADIVRRADDVARVGEAPLHGLERSQSIEREMKSERRSEVAVVRIYFDLCDRYACVCAHFVQHAAVFVFGARGSSDEESQLRFWHSSKALPALIDWLQKRSMRV